MARARLRWALFAVASAVAAVSTGPTSAALPRAPAPASWEQWRHVPGVFDLAGPRRDGRLVAAAHTRLVLVSPSGGLADFAPAYSAPDGSESYLARSPGLTVEAAGCRFEPDEILALDLRAAPTGVARISADGAVSRLATIPGASGLTGIALDTVGGFGHRLLVIGPGGPGTTRVWAVDCRGVVAPVATVNVPLEGGISVAPRSFGRYGGQLVAPDETGGSVYAISPGGELGLVARSGVPAGGDIGVESAGFVPAGGAAEAYLADRATPGNPHPGTDSILRLSGAALSGAGVRPGDLLVGTEGGATIVRIRCAADCTVSVVARGPPTAHGEGRLLVVARSKRGKGAGWLVALVGGALAILVAGLGLAVGRRQRAHSVAPDF